MTILYHKFFLNSYLQVLDVIKLGWQENWLFESYWKFVIKFIGFFLFFFISAFRQFRVLNSIMLSLKNQFERWTTT